MISFSKLDPNPSFEAPKQALFEYGIRLTNQSHDFLIRIDFLPVLQSSLAEVRKLNDVK